MRKSKMWRMITVAAVAASMTCGIIGVQSVSADDKKTLKVALESGKCDAVVTDMPTGKAACVAYPDFKLLDFSGTDGAFEVSDEDINIGISVQKGNDELKDAINGVLKDMTEDDYNKMMDEAISVQPLSES